MFAGLIIMLYEMLFISIRMECAYVPANDGLE